jgi:hypothetical protein
VIIDNDAAPNSCAYGQIDQVMVAVPGAKLPLAECSQVRIVSQCNGNVKLILQVLT